MPQTKKLLVPYDSRRPDWNPRDFLIPCFIEDNFALRSLKSGRLHQLGRVVYIGEAITENDVFAKLVDAGATIDDVELTLMLIRNYLIELQSLKIGIVVRIRSNEGSNSKSFSLESVV